MTISAGDAHPFPIYNARYRVVFPLLDADGDPISPSSPDSEVSQDQGTFADATNEATEIATSSGICYLDLISTELDTKCSAVRVQSTGAKTTVLTLYPVRLPVIRTGTAQAGAGSTITLDSGASTLDDYYNGCYINITNNDPANALGQARKIIDYVASTKVATVGSAWGTNPSSASTFEILLTPEGGAAIQLAESAAAASIQDIVDGVLDEANATHVTAGTVGLAISTGGTTSGLITTLSNFVLSLFRVGFRKDAAIATDDADAITALNADNGSGAGAYNNTTDSLEANRDNIGTAGAGLTAADDALVTLVNDLPTNAELATALGTADDAVLTQIALIKTQTDKLTFTVANVIDANVQRINDVAIVGDGAGTPWGP